MPIPGFHMTVLVTRWGQLDRASHLAILHYDYVRLGRANVGRFDNKILYSMKNGKGLNFYHLIIFIFTKLVLLWLLCGARFGSHRQLDAYTLLD